MVLKFDVRYEDSPDGQGKGFIEVPECAIPAISAKEFKDVVNVEALWKECGTVTFSFDKDNNRLLCISASEKREIRIAVKMITMFVNLYDKTIEIPKDMVNFVRGKGNKMLQRIEKMTQTKVKTLTPYSDDDPELQQPETFTERVTFEITGCMPDVEDAYRFLYDFVNSHHLYAEKACDFFSAKRQKKPCAQNFSCYQ